MPSGCAAFARGRQVRQLAMDPAKPPTQEHDRPQAAEIMTENAVRPRLAERRCAKNAPEVKVRNALVSRKLTSVKKSGE